VEEDGRITISLIYCGELRPSYILGDIGFSPDLCRTGTNCGWPLDEDLAKNLTVSKSPTKVGARLRSLKAVPGFRCTLDR